MGPRHAITLCMHRAVSHCCVPLTVPPHMHRRRNVLVVVAVLAAACGEKPAPAADTQTVADTGVAAPADVAPAAASKIGTLPVLDRLSPDHRCATQSYEGLTTIVRELTYDGDVPPRTIKVSLAAPERGFQIVNLDIRSRRETSPGQEESERVFVVFTPSGDVQSGTREYVSGADPSTNAKTGLQPGDDATAKQLAQDVVDQCGRSTR